MVDTIPEDRGTFEGGFGGQYVPETLMAALTELEEAYRRLSEDESFQRRLQVLLADYAGRPTPLYHAERLTEAWETKGKIYLKREDLNHTGAHKINNCLGQGLLAVELGKRRVLCETGAGQHGVATATVAARLGLECTVTMGRTDMERQAPNVERMRLLGAEVRGVDAGTATLKDATNEALRDWVATVRHTHYIIGSTVGPHPFPILVRDFQSVIGLEARSQILDREGRLPHTIVACVGGGSNAMGIFHPFLGDPSVRLVGVEAAGEGIDSDRTAATLTRGRPGVLHGSYSYVIQDEEGQILPTHSISAGLDYPGVGPEHSALKESGRVEYVAVTDREALDAFVETCRLEGIVPALESSHALAHARREATGLDAGESLIVNLSGRGDKDLATVLAALGQPSR